MRNSELDKLKNEIKALRLQMENQRKQYEEEINYKMLTDEESDDGYYYKFNEKVLFRTDSKTQMEYLRNGVGGMIIKPNEARRKLDMEDAEGGDVLLANGSIVPLTMAGAAYLKGESEQENTDEPEQPEKKSGGGLLAVLALLVLAGGGAFAYVKFIKPNRGTVKVSSDPDDYDFPDEEYINEDEPAQQEETEDGIE